LGWCRIIRCVPRDLLWVFGGKGGEEGDKNRTLTGRVKMVFGGDLTPVKGGISGRRLGRISMNRGVFNKLEELMPRGPKGGCEVPRESRRKVMMFGGGGQPMREK